MNYPLLAGLGRFALVGGLAAFVSACATVQSQSTAPIQARQLSSSEKDALRKSLSQTLNDPDAAQFKWLPVVATDKEPAGYCGLVNGKNVYGGYIGFRSFFAMIGKNSKGEYDHGTIEHISGRPATLFGPDVGWDEAFENGLVEGNCNRWGYTDFSQAQ